MAAIESIKYDPNTETATAETNSTEMRKTYPPRAFDDDWIFIMMVGG
ncbi:MAG: hypothetical protein HOG89_03645 [Candidatus Peribacter sp.]|nr:hypothetical protein [Candidatus Peribacter sp.]MBT4393062.1 hypothetical protein [Candidatus Peribacter sp.]MBT4600860.1 hypothetical protein [Candidatus Peribacter sp.]MBT5149009.1 hypothetical protein [Candidatus Peribacter sp.]MBT5638311.1 hypothetical protein [Candidatus Peribacter sp.]